MVKGLIHVYTGEGKGKTTAAIGLAVRAAAHGKQVLILQFLKSGVKDSRVLNILRKSGIKVIKFKGQTSPLFDPKVKLSKLKKSINRSITASVKAIKSGSYDMVVLDEFNTLLSNDFADIGDLENLLESKPDGLELVFTGRGAPKELIKSADYVTEMKMIKHPFNTGFKARKGIEF